MARFNLNGFLDNSRFEDFFAKFGGGTSGQDQMNGTTSNNTMFGGAREELARRHGRQRHAQRRLRR